MACCWGLAESQGYDSVDITFTNAGSYMRAEQKGKHVEPLTKIFASSKMLPSKAPRFSYFLV